MPTSSAMKQHRKCRSKISRGPVPPGKVCPVQPEWRFCTCSARQTKYGIQPMSPSVSEKRRSGNRPQKSAHSSSVRVRIDITEELVIFTLAGASLDAGAGRDEEPTWQ